MRLIEIAAPLILAAFITLTLTYSVSRFINNPRKSSLVVSIFLIFLYSYGHLLSINSRFYFRVQGHKIGPDINVFILWLVLLSISLFFTIRTRRDLITMTKLANTVAIVLVAFQLLIIAQTVAARSTITDNSDYYLDADIPDELPDIYHIILDGYGRHDILQEMYGVDNSGFLEDLRNRGFIIAESSHCNYYATAQSLSSQYNLNYLQTFDFLSPDDRDCMQMEDLIAQNRVFKQLDAYGYKLVTFATGYYMTDLKQADYHYTPGIAFSEFQNLVMNSTPIPFLLNRVKSQYDLHRERINYILEKLPDLNNIKQPKFVLAHLICPHPPFVFDENGGQIRIDRPFCKADGSLFTEHGGTKAEYLAGYANQVKYISKRIITTIDDIIANSDHQPIIIIQGDHGPASEANWENVGETNLRERYSILNAFYLPGQTDEIIYPSITPINSYRIIFNHYFNTEYELLADKSYFNNMSEPYAFIEITEKLVETPGNQ